MYTYKIAPCPNQTNQHDWRSCPYAHPNEHAARRDPRRFSYSAQPCPELAKTGRCPCGVSCQYSHSVFESWLHPSRYKTQFCKSGSSCNRPICFFAHSAAELRFPTPSLAGDGALPTPTATPDDSSADSLASLPMGLVAATATQLLQPAAHSTSPRMVQPGGGMAARPAPVARVHPAMASSPYAPVPPTPGAATCFPVGNLGSRFVPALAGAGGRGARLGPTGCTQGMAGGLMALPTAVADAGLSHARMMPQQAQVQVPQASQQVPFTHARPPPLSLPMVLQLQQGLPLPSSALYAPGQQQTMVACSPPPSPPSPGGVYLRFDMPDRTGNDAAAQLQQTAGGVAPDTALLWRLLQQRQAQQTQLQQAQQTQLQQAQAQLAQAAAAAQGGAWPYGLQGLAHGMAWMGSDTQLPSDVPYPAAAAAAVTVGRYDPPSGSGLGEVVMQRAPAMHLAMRHMATHGSHHQ